MNDICSYLMEKRDVNIKQELPSSSSDEYESDDDEEEEEERNVLLPPDTNKDGNENDSFEYQQSLELEMEVGHSAPAIKVIKQSIVFATFYILSNLKERDNFHMNLKLFISIQRMKKMSPILIVIMSRAIPSGTQSREVLI